MTLKLDRPIVGFEESLRREQSAVDAAIKAIITAAEKRARKAEKRLRDSLKR